MMSAQSSLISPRSDICYAGQENSPGARALHSKAISRRNCGGNLEATFALGPIAAGFASKLGYGPDAFLMAVAIGAACDFLTPIGHQCNTLVMGPGGYRLGDYWRLGLPLSLMVVLVGIPLITIFWPLKA